MASSVFVTGASSGLGLAASAELAATGRHVILGCRDVGRGREAMRRIRARTPEASLEVLETDLASLASVRAAAEELRGGRRPELHGLVCNAGVQVVSGVGRTADGHELTFGVNYLGHFLLARLLMDHLARPGRIVTVSSGTHYGPPRSGWFPGPRWRHPRQLADPDDSALDGSQKAGRIRYATSKLACVYLTYELSRRLRDRDVTADAYDPGLMPQTRIGRDYSPGLRRLHHLVGPLLLALPEVRTPESSGADLAWTVTAPELADVTGAYFVGRKPRASSKESYDRDRAAQLWDVSEELVAAAI
ncbi:MAG: SDR family NAD(P)-dependent oxidoreductase [Stackebrandtia sp.]